jgi:hypothetical protein
MIWLIFHFKDVSEKIFSYWAFYFSKCKKYIEFDKNINNIWRLKVNSKMYYENKNWWECCPDSMKRLDCSIMSGNVLSMKSYQITLTQMVDSIKVEAKYHYFWNLRFGNLKLAFVKMFQTLKL